MKTKEKKVVITSELKVIPIEQIVLGSSNPRKFFDDEALKELAASIKEKGLLQPVLVRKGKKANTFELICGERRYRACKLINEPSLFVNVREISDDEVIELQITENLQRKDVHPMDEANAIRILLDSGKTKEDIKNRLGVSLKFVTHRLHLTNLCNDFAEMFFNNRFSISEALKLADLPLDIQTTYFEDCYNDWKENSNKIGLHDYQLNNYRGFLNRNTFPLEIEINGVGACTTCPFNSMNFVSLFEEDKNKHKHVCNKISCFQDKKMAWEEQQLKELVENNIPVVKSGYNSNDAKNTLNNIAARGAKAILESNIQTIDVPEKKLDFETYFEENFNSDEEDEDYQEDLEQAKIDYDDYCKDLEKETEEFNTLLNKGEIIPAKEIDYNGKLKDVFVKKDEAFKPVQEEKVEEGKAQDLEAFNKALELEARRREIDYEKLQASIFENVGPLYQNIDTSLELAEKTAFVYALAQCLDYGWQNNVVVSFDKELIEYNPKDKLLEHYNKNPKAVDNDLAVMQRLLILKILHWDKASKRTKRKAEALYDALLTQLPNEINQLENEMHQSQNERQLKFKAKIDAIGGNFKTELSNFNKKNPL